MNTRRFRVKKLVRDNIPTHLMERGIRYTARTVERTEYLDQLKEKLIEEANEVRVANSSAVLLEEISDVLEVVVTLANECGFSLDELISQRTKKRGKNGGLEYRTYIDETEIDVQNKSIQYYLARPKEYPEIID